MHGCSGGREACVVAPGGGLCGCSGGMHGCSGGQRAWLLQGGMHGEGACMAKGGHVW